MSRKIASKAGLVGLILVGGAAALSACSSSDSGTPGGTAGSVTGTAGKSGTGGSGTTGTAGSGTTGTAGSGTTGTAGSGTTGTAGSGAGGAGAGFACAGDKPTGALITDFSDLVAATSPAGEYTFGGTAGIKGGTFSYPAGTFTYTTAAKSLELKGHVANYDGFGLYFNTCTDASAYTGVSFSVKGSVGTTGMMTFSFQTNADQGIDTVNKHGTCPTKDLSNDYNECHFATYSFPVTATATTVTVKFSDPTMGLPVATVDGKDLLGLQWSFAWKGATDTAYDADVTIDDVMFIGGTNTGTGGAGGTGAGGASGGSAGAATGGGGAGGAAAGAGGASGGAGGTGGAH